MSVALLSYLFSALWLGFIVAIPPGAVTVIGFQYSLKNNFFRTLCFIAGSSLVDIGYLLLVYAGFATILYQNVVLRVAMYFVSGSLLLYMGFGVVKPCLKSINCSKFFCILRQKLRFGQTQESYQVSSGTLKRLKPSYLEVRLDFTSKEVSEEGNLTAFLKGIAVTITNPPTVVGWLAVAGNFFLLWRERWAESKQFELLSIPFIIIGVELWFVPLLYFVHRSHRKISDTIQTVINVASGLIIIIFGSIALVEGITQILKLTTY